MWIKQLSIWSKIWPEKKKVSNWYYKQNNEIILAVTWSAETNSWQGSISYADKRKEVVIIWEKDLDVAKLKSLVKAKELGWDIKDI